jgi:transmembrane sensor
MTIAEEPAEGGEEALAREAAHRFARTRSPDAHDHRAELEAWLAEAPEHRAAYNRAAEIFAMGKLLGEPDAPSPPHAPPRRHRGVGIALASIAACVVAIGGWVVSHPSGLSPVPQEAVASTTDHRALLTRAGEARLVRLADGSTVHLASDTKLAVDIGTSARQLRLMQGSARFEVAHEKRVFIVLAGGGSVTARGTIFEVALARTGKVEVRLLRGAVDVALPRGAPTSQPVIRRLAPGQGFAFPAQQDASVSSDIPNGTLVQPTATPRAFEAIPVADLVALANRTSARPIRLADPALGARRVSGWFRVDDTGVLARRLGALLRQSVETQDPREIVLAQPSEGPPAATTGRPGKAP